MLKLDPDNLAITCPQGDTGLVLVKLTDPDGAPLPPIDGVAVFAVAEKARVGVGYIQRSWRAVPIVDNTATILITNAMSRRLEPGEYFWDVRIVTDPEYNEDGDVIAEDDSDEVHSLFAARPEGLPDYIVPGVAVNV